MYVIPSLVISFSVHFNFCITILTFILRPFLQYENYKEILVFQIPAALKSRAKIYNRIVCGIHYEMNLPKVITLKRISQWSFQNRFDSDRTFCTPYIIEIIR